MVCCSCCRLVKEAQIWAKINRQDMYHSNVSYGTSAQFDGWSSVQGVTGLNSIREIQKDFHTFWRLKIAG